MKVRVLGLISLALSLVGCMAAEPLRPELPISEVVVRAMVALPTQTPVPTLLPTEQVLAESGLLWRECVVSDLDWRQAEACLGDPPALEGDAEQGRVGVRTDRGLVLRIGQDVYEARTGTFGPLYQSVLYRNGRRQRTIWDGTPFHAPNISLQRIDGQVAWEFYGERVQTIVVDRRGLCARYRLDAAYRPYELGGKLIFVGKKDDQAYIVYNGQRVGPYFDEIPIGYCCESMLYAPRFGQGRYVFWGKREGSYRVVEITSAAPSGP